MIQGRFIVPWVMIPGQLTVPWAMILGRLIVPWVMIPGQLTVPWVMIQDYTAATLGHDPRSYCRDSGSYHHERYCSSCGKVKPYDCTISEL